MKFLVVLPLLAAAVMAAPAPGLLAAHPVGLTFAAPAVTHVQVPVTKTVHYGVQNVVTGYSTSIIKPAIAAPIPAVHVPAVVAAPHIAKVQLHQDAPPFDQLVTKEKVLAPVRTHTQITPQITRVEPEVTIRKVVHEVPVATPVVAAPIVHHKVAAPVVHHQFISAGHVAGVHGLGLHGFSGIHGIHGIHGLHGLNGVQFV